MEVRAAGSHRLFRHPPRIYPTPPHLWEDRVTVYNEVFVDRVGERASRRVGQAAISAWEVAAHAGPQRLLVCRADVPLHAVCSGNLAPAAQTYSCKRNIIERQRHEEQKQTGMLLLLATPVLPQILRSSRIPTDTRITPRPINSYIATHRWWYLPILNPQSSAGNP